MADRELLARVDGNGTDGAASILIDRAGSQFEFVVTEEKGGDASVMWGLTSELSRARAYRASALQR